MPRKNSKDQNNHDECVRTIADELVKDKWDVKANIEGWEKPSGFGGLRPDIEASKGCLKRVCEVVTEKDLGTDTAQLTALRDYCEEYDFHLYVVGKDGKRKVIDPKTFGKK